MKAVGIVAEYNPFHLGHAYHIAETRRLLGEDRPVVCVMSGHWVQRGECALTDKWTRTAMALRGGADLVLELPVPWALSSAEGFARGAVGVLKAAGVVDTLSFGSESGRLEELRTVAKCLEGAAYRAALHEELTGGVPFAEARQKAALRALGPGAETLRGANDNLGVEYLRAAGEDLAAVAVPRQGAAHDSPAPGAGFASASYLRAAARKGAWRELTPWMTEGAPAELQRAGLAGMEQIQRAMLARLRQMDRAELERIPDSGGGLAGRILAAAGEAGSLEELYARAKTKAYAHARIRRVCLWAFLGLEAADRPAETPYLRVLGFTPRGQALLREMKQTARVPVITKPAHARGLEGQAQRTFALEARCTDLFALCYPTPRPSGWEWLMDPVRTEGAERGRTLQRQRT